MKKWITLAWLCLLMTVVFSLFWYNQLVYSLPTPIPSGYKTVASGKKIHLAKGLDFRNDKPTLLHFFNPDCPCSRFNIDHFKSLVKTYRNEVNFAVVLMTNKSYTEKEIQDRFDLMVPVVKDSVMAVASGVYSTPQAVVLNSKGNLFYRGNYNKSRYCTDEKTSYANIALKNVLSHKNVSLTDQLAFKAYGCTLPNCNN